MKLWAFASLAASITSLSDDPCLPYKIFSYIVVAKSTGSCCTRPMCLRIDFKCSFLISLPVTSN